MHPVLVAERHPDAERPTDLMVGSGRRPSRPRRVAQVVRGTWRTALRHRVTGLAAEAGFFALLSLPPLLLSVVAGAGLAERWAGAAVLTGLESRLEQLGGVLLTTDASGSVVTPMLREVVHGGRLDVVSVGFVVALWSGSRALNVYVDTVSIMYGYGGHRGIVRTRALSFSLYVAVVLAAVVVAAAVLLGIGAAARWWPTTAVPGWPGGGASWLALAAVVPVSVLGAAALYQVATPVRLRWRHHLPGAVVAVALGVAAGVVLRFVVAVSLGGSSLYGPLAAPIVMLLWLYLVALAVLVGAALNAAVEEYGSACPEAEQG